MVALVYGFLVCELSYVFKGIKASHRQVSCIFGYFGTHSCDIIDVFLLIQLFDKWPYQ